jgi:hypothetical protein
MKPTFIYKYNKDKTKNQKQFFNMFKTHGAEIEKEFGNVDPDQKAASMGRQSTTRMLVKKSTLRDMGSSYVTDLVREDSEESHEFTKSNE